MDQLFFWSFAIGLTVLVAAAVFWPMLRGNASFVPRASHDLDVYTRQLAELDRDIGRGAVPPDQAESAKAEIGRRLLRAAAQAQAATVRGSARQSFRLVRFAAMSFAACLLVGSVGLYLFLGAPGRFDQPLEARLSADPAKADLATLVAQAETRLRRAPDDGRGWDAIAPIYLSSGRPADAVAAVGNAIRLLGSTAEREALRGEAAMQAASGKVTRDARDAFTKALQLDPANVAARFYLAVDLSRQNRHRDAASAWKALIDRGPPDAPWMPNARMALAEAVRLAQDKRQDAPVLAQAGPNGPTADDMANAAALPVPDRQAMIDGMVSRLSARLKTAPNDADGWKRLMRSYAVLGDDGNARAAYRDALRVFAEETTDRKSIEEMATALGLTGTVQ